jgi:hypothetical protein
MIERIEQNVMLAVVKNDSRLVFDLLGRLNEFGKVSALGHAATFWTARENWGKIVGQLFKDVDQRDENFYGVMFHKGGYTLDTIRRYCLAWHFLMLLRNQRVKAKLWESFANRSIQELITLGQNVKEYGAFTGEQLEALALEPDLSSLRKTIRKLRGQQEQANGALTLVKREDGTIEVWEGDNSSILGHLQARDALGERGLARILKRSRIEER